ncbi:hypothetical protein ACO0LB_17890 [Undibacterium sp. SXout7W]
MRAKRTLELNADQFFEVFRGLELRVVECEKMLKKSKSSQAQDEWADQLNCARRTLETVEEIRTKF